MYFGYGSPCANEGRSRDSKDWMFSDRCFPCLGPSSLPLSAVHTHCAHTVQEICTSRECHVRCAHTQGQKCTYTVILRGRERIKLTAHVWLGEPWVNRGYRQSRPGMLGGVGLAKGV